ncbi:hypothetical protein VNO78_31550 [Psophocarpus tetragonolobus]|uniref:Uncharacterized protein n=1 Tax=Psophocarpus tetragonolobus TaxID=3891 RepID=A0AAN9RZ41_PSOTE
MREKGLERAWNERRTRAEGKNELWKETKESWKYKLKGRKVNTYFFTHFSDNFGEKELWKIVVRWGQIYGSKHDEELREDEAISTTEPHNAKPKKNNEEELVNSPPGNNQLGVTINEPEVVIIQRLEQLQSRDQMEIHEAEQVN